MESRKHPVYSNDADQKILALQKVIEEKEALLYIPRATLKTTCVLQMDE